MSSAKEITDRITRADERERVVKMLREAVSRSGPMARAKTLSMLKAGAKLTESEMMELSVWIGHRAALTAILAIEQMTDEATP